MSSGPEVGFHTELDAIGVLTISRKSDRILGLFVYSQYRQARRRQYRRQNSKRRPSTFSSNRGFSPVPITPRPANRHQHPVTA
jgi:hypothetical protein